MTSLAELGDRLLAEYSELVQKWGDILDDDDNVHAFSVYLWQLVGLIYSLEDFGMDSTGGSNAGHTEPALAPGYYARASTSGINAEEVSERPAKAPRANRRKREKKSRDKRGLRRGKNMERTVAAQHKRDEDAQVATSDNPLSTVEVASTGRQGIKEPHPEVRDWENLSLGQKQKLLAPLKIIMQERCLIPT